MRKCDLTPGFAAALCVGLYLDRDGILPRLLLAAAVHEGAHLAVLRLRGKGACGLRLTALGAVIETPVLDYRTEALCAAAGPAVNLALFFLTRRLDGGKALRAALFLHISPGRAETAARIFEAAALGATALCAAWACAGARLGLWPAAVEAWLLVRVAMEKQVVNWGGKG